MARQRSSRARWGRWLHRLVAGSAVVSTGLALPALTPTTGLADLPPPITVFVQGHAEYVPPGTTFDQIVSRFHLRARDGNLVAVDGTVLRPSRFLGEILLDGSPPDAAVAGGEIGSADALRDGDRITIRNGVDQREQIFITQLPVPAGTPLDPQRTLTTAEGTITVARGSLSGIVLSWRFHQTGPSVTPNSVALTFDDGPWPGSTDRILAVLQKFEVPATFFVVGSLAARFPQLVRMEADAGMAFGDHSFDHPLVPPFGRQPASKARSEMAMTMDALAAAGVRPALFRPPGGSYAPSTLDIARSLGLRVVLWSVDPADWTPGITTKQIVARVLSAVQPGSIVLLHDGGGDRTATLKALPAIIKGIRTRHLDLVALTS